MFWVCSFIELAQNTITRLQHHFCQDAGKFYRIFTLRFSFWLLFDTKRLKAVCFQIVMLMTYRLSRAAIQPVLKALFTFRNWFLDVKSTLLLHSNSQNVSLISLCDSFDVLTAFVLFNQSKTIKSFGPF